MTSAASSIALRAEFPTAEPPLREASPAQLRTRAVIGPATPRQAPSTEFDSPRLVACCLIAGTSIAHAIQINDGMFCPRAIIAITFALICLTPLLWIGGARRSHPATRKYIPRIVYLALGLQFLQLLATNLPGGARGPHADWPFRSAIIFAAVLTAAGMLDIKPLRKIWFPALLAVFLSVAVWDLRSTPAIFIDVRTVQQQGLKAFVHGHNPYDITFRDTLHRPEAFLPGSVKNGIVHLGFCYAPLTLFLDLPGYLLAGDFRYSNAVCMLLTAICIALIRPGLFSRLVAVLYLFTPRAFFVLESGWTEPGVTLFLALLMLVACRSRRLTPYLLGLFLVSKQYLVFALAPILLIPGIVREKSLDDASGQMPGESNPSPFLVRFLSRVNWRALLIAFVVGAIVSLPVILWNTSAALHSLIDAAANSGLRRDSLSYLSMSLFAFGYVPPYSTGFVLAALATPLVLWRLGRTPAAYAAAIGILYALFFAFGKMAFCNYYYFVLSCLLCAAAAAKLEQPIVMERCD